MSFFHHLVSGEEPEARSVPLCHLRHFAEILNMPDAGKILQEKSPQHTVTRNTAEKQFLARVLDPLQQGIPVGLLPYWRVPVSAPLASQEHTLAALPKPTQEQKTIHRYLQL